RGELPGKMGVNHWQPNFFTMIYISLAFLVRGKKLIILSDRQKKEPVFCLMANFCASLVAG
ncbi:MAG: hypothetical protein WCD53_16730, partial [Microcoleus sp.]